MALELFRLAYATSCLCFAASRQKQSLRVHGACDHYQCSPERAPINYITITKSCAIKLQFNPPSCSLCHKAPKYGCSHFIKLSFHCVCRPCCIDFASAETTQTTLGSKMSPLVWGTREFYIYRPLTLLTIQSQSQQRIAEENFFIKFEFL
jgi:hypothetical protein